MFLPDPSSRDRIKITTLYHRIVHRRDDYDTMLVTQMTRSHSDDHNALRDKLEK